MTTQTEDTNMADETMADVTYRLARIPNVPIEHWNLIAETISTIIELRTELARLREQLETERIRLAACGVVAMSNTPESAAKAREMLPIYWSASCGDVEKAVDREMALRTELASARVNEARFRFMRKNIDDSVDPDDGSGYYWHNHRGEFEFDIDEDGEQPSFEQVIDAAISQVQP